jgi:hypothetical protein
VGLPPTGTRGNLQFVGENGVTGTLHLKDDTVTLGR